MSLFYNTSLYSNLNCYIIVETIPHSHLYPSTPLHNNNGFLRLTSLHSMNSKLLLMLHLANRHDIIDYVNFGQTHLIFIIIRPLVHR